jgi:hypothetical protein
MKFCDVLIFLLDLFHYWLICRNESPAEGLASADVDQDLDVKVII